MSANGRRKPPKTDSPLSSRGTKAPYLTVARHAAESAAVAQLRTKIQAGLPVTASIGVMANPMTLARVKMKPEDNAIALVAREEAFARANAYEQRNKQSGHGLAIRLGSDDTFWSKGTKACPIGCFGRVDDWNVKLHYSEVRGGGVVTRRWSCIPTMRESTNV